MGGIGRHCLLRLRLGCFKGGQPVGRGLSSTFVLWVEVPGRGRRAGLPSDTGRLVVALAVLLGALSQACFLPWHRWLTSAGRVSACSLCLRRPQLPEVLMQFVACTDDTFGSGRTATQLGQRAVRDSPDVPQMDSHNLPQGSSGIPSAPWPKVPLRNEPSQVGK